MRVRSSPLSTTVSRWVRVGLLALALFGCKGSAARRDAATAVPARRLPDTTLATVAIDDPKALLDGLRGQFRDPGAGVPIPANVAELVERWAALHAAVRSHIPENARTRIVFIDHGDRVVSAIGVRVRREANAALPFGVEVPLFDGGPGGSRFVSGQPVDGGAAMVLSGDVLVLGDDVRTVDESVSYLSGEGMRADGGEGLAVHVRERAIEQRLRPYLDAELEERTEGALASARAERARHADAPAFGEPEQIVRAIRDRLRRWLAYLPDVGDTDLRLTAGTSGVSLLAESDVVAASPLARALDAGRYGAPFGLDRLPTGTALAISARRAADERPWVDVLAPIAGQAFDEAARARFEAAASRLDTMRGAASVVAFGAHDDGPFALAGFEPGTVAFEPDAVRAVLALPYVASAVGRVLGCETLRVGSLARGEASLCTGEGATPDVSVASGARGAAVAVAARGTSSPTPHGAVLGFAGTDRGASLFGDPDAERALGRFGDRTLLVLVLSGRAIVPALGLFGSPTLRAMSASRRSPTDASPLLLGVERGDGPRVRLRVEAPPRSLAELYSVAYLAAAMAGE